MGNDMIPYAFAIGEKYTCFMYNHYNFIENEKLQDGTLLNATNHSLDPYEFHVQICGSDSLKTMEIIIIQNLWPEEEEDDENEDE